jgi:uncharacterized protein YgbK (DUF1537 family)
MAFNASVATAGRLKGGTILIIADDLTGAADSAVPFRQVGFSAVVLSGVDKSHAVRRRAQVTSLSLNTRDISPVAVRRTWARYAPAITALAQHALVYHKIDSTMRGHAPLEVRLLLSLIGASAALIAPAFPKLGRQTLGGVHQVYGVPLAQTEYARRPGRGQPTSRLDELFTTADGQPPVHLPLRALDQGAAHVSDCLQECLHGPRCLITADAADERHLDILTAAALPLVDHLLLVGSAGWAERLALACQEQLGAPSSAPGVLAVVGSLNSATTRQVQVAAQAGAALWRFSATDRDPSRCDSAQHRQAVAQALMSGRHALLWTNPDNLAPPSWRLGRRVLRALAQSVRDLLLVTPVSGLALVGGETAGAVMRALQASGLTLAGEIQPGLPFGRLLDGPFAALPVATKAGGFGAETALLECLQFLHRWGSQ